jgi:hypothetical protein
MLQRLASTAFVVGTLLTASIPVVSFARDGGRSEGGRGASSGRSAGGSRGQSFSGGSRNYAPRGFSGGNRYSGGQNFVSPRGGNEGRRGYSGDYSRGYVAPRSYGRPVYRGYYDRGLYLGYGAPYGYGYAYDSGYAYGYPYDPGYAYGQGYSYGPAPVPQACAAGSYDRYGNWVPNPNCYSSQPQYPPQQQNYDPNQQQRYNR